MAIENKRMQQRHGTYSKFVADKGKYIPGEFQVVQSNDPNSGTGKGIYIAMDASNCEQMATFENVKKVVGDSAEDIKNDYLASIQKATSYANTATSKANAAASSANTAAQDAANAAEDARGVIDQITKDSYLHTTTQTFVDTVKASPTAYGNAIPEQIEGDIRQDTTKGLQLFDASKMNGYTTSGVHCEVSSDGTIRTKGTLTANYLTSRHPDIIDIKQGEKYSIKIFANKTMANVYVGLTPDDGSFDAQVNFTNTENSGTFTAKSNLVDFVVGANLNGLNMDGLEFKVMITKGEPANWEPYTGGQPSPNPDYPQIVHGAGDMGFFDGELVLGAWNDSNGTFSPNNDLYVSGPNIIPCKPNDQIIIEYGVQFRATWIIWVNKDGSFISSQLFQNVKRCTAVAPTNCYGFKFSISEKSSVSNVEATKSILVLINDKYAVCVKSKGKNLLNLTGEILYSFGRETIFDSQVTINPTTDGRTAPGVWFILGDIKKFLGKTIYVKADVIQRSGNYNPRMLLMTIKGNTSVRTYLTYSYSKAGQVMSVKIPDDLDTNEVSDLALNMYVNDGSSQVDADAYAIFTNVYAGLSEPTNEFVPYQSNVTYIPVDYPLFEGDKIVRRNGEYKLLRKWGMETFDGSVVWGKNSASEDDYLYYYSRLPEKDTSGKLYCDRLKHIKSADPGIGVQLSSYYPKALYVRLSANELPVNDIEHFSEWIQEHPLTFVYPLATPTEESLSPEAQKAIHSIMACDELTTLEIVGVPSDAEIQNQFLLPRNEDGALNTTAYCTAKRNEIALEELVAQSLDARVNKLEVDNESLNLQTLIVE